MWGIQSRGDTKMTSSIVQDVATLTTELEALQQKSRADDSLIGVLKERVDALVREVDKLRNAHVLEAGRLKGERDSAIQMVEEVQGIIMSIADRALKGIERMRPRDQVVETSTVVIQGDNRIPVVLYDEQPEEPKQLAKPELMRPTGGTVEEDVEDAIRPFIRRVGVGGSAPTN